MAAPLLDGMRIPLYNNDAGFKTRHNEAGLDEVLIWDRDENSNLRAIFMLLDDTRIVQNTHYRNNVLLRYETFWKNDYVEVIDFAESRDHPKVTWQQHGLVVDKPSLTTVR